MASSTAVSGDASTAEPLTVYDTYTRRKEPFKPRQAGVVSMYVCGPTVYDVPHLGHGRTALTYDVMRRYLTWRGFKVTLASNITDIDDKIIARAAAEDRTEPEVAAEFTASYDKEMERLGVLPPDSRPHATQFVRQMVEVIEALIESGAAYVVPERGVYMAVEPLPDYGTLAGRTVEQLTEDAGSRVEIDTHKRSPLDFALWKQARPGEPTWDTPWGQGRPGWHTECVAMSLAALGEDFDIHGGGSDLVFPHHQNEWAQVQALGRKFARYWVHSAMVNVQGRKMAKSEGNYTNLSEAVDAVGPRAVRLAALQTHYRKPMEMGEKSLTAAAAATQRLDAFARRLLAAGYGEALAPWLGLDLGNVENQPTAAGRNATDTGSSTLVEFAQAMDDDFGTPTAVDVAFRALREANSSLDATQEETTQNSQQRIAQLAQAVLEIFAVLGIGVLVDASGEQALTDSQIEALLQERDQARSAKDFERADQIRDELLAEDVAIEDTPTGTIWRRL